MSATPHQQKSLTNIFVSGLPPGTDDAKLLTMFSSFGEIVSAKVMVDLKTKQLRNNGFVNFKQPGCAAEAVKHYAAPEGGETPKGHLSVVYAGINASEAPAPNKTIYIRNLPETVTPAGLREVFVQFGNITEVVIPPDQHAVGFVKFERVEDAAKAVDTMHNTSPFGLDHVLQVRFKALPRNPTNIAQNTKGGTPPAPGRHAQPAPSNTERNRTNSNTNSPAAPIAMQQVQYIPVDTGSFAFVQPPSTYSTPGVPCYQAVPAHPGLPPGAVPVSTVPVPLMTPTLTPTPPHSMPTSRATTAGNFIAVVQPIVSSPFPSKDDIFISGYPTEDWLKAVISVWKPTQMEPMAGGMCVRFANPADHVKIADQLSTMISPSTADRLQVAIIED